MQPFALSRVDDPATAIAAHARDPELAFIAGGTDLQTRAEGYAKVTEAGLSDLRSRTLGGLPQSGQH